MNARHVSRDQAQKGFGSVLEEMLELEHKTIYASFIGTRIEYLSEFDINEEGAIKDVRWCAGVVKAISDGTAPKWLKQNAARACYKDNEAALIDWDAITKANMEAGESIVKPNHVNKIRIVLEHGVLA